MRFKIQIDQMLMEVDSFLRQEMRCSDLKKNQNTVSIDSDEFMESLEDNSAPIKASPEARRLVAEAALARHLGLLPAEALTEATRLRELSLRISALRVEIEELDSQRNEIVKRLRELGMSWARIAKSAGIRQTSAQRKWDND